MAAMIASERAEFAADVTVMLKPVSAYSRYDLWLSDGCLAVLRNTHTKTAPKVLRYSFVSAEAAAVERSLLYRKYVDIGILPAAAVAGLPYVTVAELMHQAIEQHWVAPCFGPLVRALTAPALGHGVPHASYGEVGLTGACVVAAFLQPPAPVEILRQNTLGHAVAQVEQWRASAVEGRAPEAEAAIARLCQSLRRGPPEFVAQASHWQMEGVLHQCQPTAMADTTRQLPRL